ncbi:MAG TPA: hemolysin family protein [Candidatus Tyrphobacter sp.]
MAAIEIDWFAIVALGVLVVTSAFFSASEAALISVSRLRARTMAERRVRGAGAVVHLIDHRNRFLTSVLIGNTVALLAADSLATSLAFRMRLPQPAVVSTIVMSIVLLLFGETIPKTVASSDGERWALRFAPAMRAAAWILTPIANTFLLVTALILRPFGIHNVQRLFVTEEDIRTLVNVGAEQRVIEEQEREMIHSVIEFGDTIAREVMTPRPEMVAVSVDATPRRALDIIIAEGHSRLPVYQESKDDIIGVVHDRELMIALATGAIATTTIRALMRPCVHVPESKKIADLLREMQREKFSLAIVVDEYGGTAGLVTMEDLLEEIVGEIRDEHDLDEQEPFVVVSPQEAIVDARTNIEDVNARLGTELPTEDFETIGGYTVGRFGRLPAEGEEIEADDRTRLRVERAHGRRILSVRIHYNGALDGEPETDAGARTDAHDAVR